MSIHITAEIPREVLDLWTRFSSGHIGAIEFLNEAEALRKKLSSKLETIEI